MNKRKEIFELKKQQKHITTDQFSIITEHDQVSNSDTITKTGKNAFSLTLKEPMNGYGMCFGNYFFEISKKIFFYVQAYEHSRGGHHDENFVAISHKGKVLWQKYLYGYSPATIVVNKDRNKLCLLNDFTKNRKELRQSERLYLDCNIEEIDINTGETLQSRPVYLPDRFHIDAKKINAYYETLHLSPFSAKFVEKKNEIFLEIYFGSFAIQAIKDETKYRIALSDILQN